MDNTPQNAPTALPSPLRILINGYRGRMGQEIVAAIEAAPDLSCVALTTRGDDLAASLQDSQAQIAIDVSLPDSVYATTQCIIEQGVHPIIGTSGLTDQQIEHLSARCQSAHLGGIIAPNFSLGALLMMKFAAQAARYLPDIEIIEAHHPNKIDAPSGTALKTAQLVHAGQPDAYKAKAAMAKQPPIGARGHLAYNIPIHALRLPGIVAQQQVLCGGQEETLSITHNTRHRRAFMPGVLFACRQVMGLKHLVYGLEQLL